MRAVWNGTVVAESDETVVVEGNHYFPAESIRPEFFVDSATETMCPWKGTARYKSVVVDGRVATDGAWYYPTPKDKAAKISGRFAFWRGVVVEPSTAEVS
jgi:uncharacterized protein (DUF427 family)